MKTIAISADDAVYAFRDTIVAYLNGLGTNVTDYSSDKCQGSTVYPDAAYTVVMSTKQSEHERSILTCDTGIGMSVVVNKVPGVRTTQCHDTFSAERTHKSNNVQIAALGVRVTGTELGKKIIQVWPESEYEGGGSAPKVEHIDYYEHQRARD